MRPAATGRGAVRVIGVWLRGALRQPARAAIVVLTLVVMTMGTGAALVAGDSLEQLFVADARAEWGDVDVEVTDTENGAFPTTAARLVGVESPSAAAWSPRLVLPAVLRTPDVVQPDGLVLGLPPEDQSFPPLTARSGTADWLGLGADQAILNERAAERLGLAVGDELELTIGVPRVVLRSAIDDRIEAVRQPRGVVASFEVAGIVADAHVADLHRTPNVLLRLDRLQRRVGLDGRVNVLHLAAGDDHPDAARRLLREVDAVARLSDLEADPVLLDQLAIAEDEGGQFRSLLLTLAVLIVAAAAIATAQMLTALAEDRSDEVAVLRSLGVRRSTVQWLVAVEAVVYGVVAAGVGLWLSLPVAGAIAGALADHFASLSAGRGREQVQLAAEHDPVTLATGAVVVLATAAIAGVSAGRRLGRVDVDVLLRGPLERLPAASPSMRRPLLLALAGALLLGMGLTGGVASDALRFLGLTLLGAAWWTRARRTDGTGAVDQRFAIGALAWSTLGAGLLADFTQGYETGFAILVVAGVVAIVATAVLVVPRFRAVMRVVRLYLPTGPTQVSLRTAGAYAEDAPGRTGRLYATFGIVLFLAAALHVLGNAQQLPTHRQSGGFDVIADSVVGVDAPELRRLDAVDEVVAMPSAFIPEDAYGTQPAGNAEAPPLRLRYPARLVATPTTLADAQDFGLADALPAYPTARDALAAVVASADKAVVDRYALPPGARVGDDVVIDVGDGTRRFQLIAVLDTFLLDAVFVNSSEFHRIAPSPGANFVLASAADATTPTQLLAALEQDQQALGLTGDTVAEAASDVVAVNRTFTDVFALMLLIGLGVAVVAVAASLARAARERRQTLAGLHVLGMPRWALALTLAAEPVVVAVVGSVTGLAAGLAVLRVLFLLGFSELAFVVDGTDLLAAGAALVALLVVTTVLTAWPVARIDAAAHADAV